MTYESLWNECMLMAGSTGAGDLNGFDISVTDFTSAEMGRVIEALCWLLVLDLLFSTDERCYRYPKRCRGPLSNGCTFCL